MPALPEAPSIAILVLKEHGVGSPALAQPYLDKFVAIAAEQNDWPSAKGQYYTNRSGAESFITSQHPHYAILSLPAFLAFKSKYGYQVIGQVAVKLVGGRQYYLISKSATDLAGCRGKPLASDHGDDARFIDKVVAAGQFTLSDFSIVQTQRPLQTIKKVLDGEAVCALVDDAQLAELPHLDGAEGVHAVWKSRELPPMPVVAFANASADERKHFQENLSKLCDDEGESACGEVGIVELKPAGDADYAALLRAYGK
jgi:hypothetical protein